jgi:2-aminoadipate transaminase
MKASVFSAMSRRTPEPPISWLMKMTLDHPHLISLAAGFTDNESLPVEHARELLAEILRSPRTGRPALQYGTTMGDATLRRLTADRIAQLDGRPGAPDCCAERTLLSHGSQQLLYLVTEALCDPGDIVLVEDPTYFVYLGITKSHGLRCRGVRMEADGLELDHLERTLEELKRAGELPRVKLLYLVSYFQNPSGVTTSFAKKAAALALLRRYERATGHAIYLLEDAAYRELRFAGDDVPSALAAPRAADRVIYTGTYSKPFATGVRVGFGIMPPALLEVVARLKGNHDFGTTNLLQQLLSRALSSGRYDKHLATLRARYTHKAAVMVEAARRHLPAEVRWAEPRGGLYIWAALPGGRAAGPKSKFFQAALERDVLYVPGELCYADDSSRRKPANEMRLSFGGARVEDIREGIKRLGEVIRGEN